MGHAFTHGAIGPSRRKSLLRRRFQALPKATVKFGDQLIRVYGDVCGQHGLLHIFLHEGR